MAIIQVTCPQCRRGLTFQESPGYMEKMLKCPVCSFTAKVSVFMRGAAGGQAQGADDSETCLVNTPGRGIVTDPGQIRVSSTGATYPLRKGQNLIGRQCSTASADIRIAPDDPYMSRKHVRIDVVRVGVSLDHHLVEINSKNIVRLNGSPINRGDILKLHFGDRLTLGTTDIILEPSIEDEDATRLV